MLFCRRIVSWFWASTKEMVDNDRVSPKQKKTECPSLRISMQIEYDSLIAMGWKKLQCKFLGCLEFEMVEIFRG